MVFHFATSIEINVLPDRVVPMGSKLTNHGGADFFLLTSFLKAVANEDSSLISSGIKDSLRSHKLVFAAEKSRLNGTIEIVDI